MNKKNINKQDNFMLEYIKFLESKLIYHNHELRDLRIEFLQTFYNNFY